MKSIWKGTINFGIVTVPVRMYSASEENKVSLNKIDLRDNNRIEYKNFNKATSKEVDKEYIGKGYETVDGTMVVVTDDELDEIAGERSQSINIEEFVPESEISSLYFDKPYYLEPDKTAGRAYHLLRYALVKSNKVGIAQFVFRSTEHLCALKVVDKAIVLQMLRFDNEVRDSSELNLQSDIEQTLTANERSLAKQLLEKMTTKFEPAKYKNEYVGKLQDLIARKVETLKNGKPVVKGKAKVAKVPNINNDLIAILQASIAAK